MPWLMFAVSLSSEKKGGKASEAELLEWLFLAPTENRRITANVIKANLISK
jgi:hypothetical protein